MRSMFRTVGLLAIGISGALAPASARAACWLHHGWCSHSYAPSAGVPATGFAVMPYGVTSSSFAVTPVVSGASSFGVLPTASSFGVLPATTSFGVLPTASSFAVLPTVGSYGVPASAFAVAPVSGSSSFSAFSSLSAGNTLAGSGGGGTFSSYAVQSALNRATVQASAAEAQGAAARYSALASAAQGRGLHGGKFILFLKELLGTAVSDFTGIPLGGGGSGGKDALFGVLSGVLRFFGIDPQQGGGVQSDMASLIDEIFGGSPSTSTGPGSAGGRSYTIRVYVDGGGSTSAPTRRNTSGTSDTSNDPLLDAIQGLGGVQSSVAPTKPSTTPPPPPGPGVVTSGPPAGADALSQTVSDLKREVEDLKTSVQGLQGLPDLIKEIKKKTDKL